MRELSLFSGAGGGLLATKHLLGWETVGYVENNEYCQKVLRARIADGLLDAAPIFGDIRKFLSDGYAAAYQGMVDVVTGGFPCQPFSNCGKQLEAADERNMWPATIECIRTIRPRFAFLENVSGLLSKEYSGVVFWDLAKIGYGFKWLCISGRDCGAPIERQRLFIACADESNGQEGMGVIENRAGKIWRRKDSKCPEFWLQAASDVAGMGDGLADYVGRVEAIGNGQVPIVAATAWQILTGENQKLTGEMEVTK